MNKRILLIGFLFLLLPLAGSYIQVGGPVSAPMITKQLVADPLFSSSVTWTTPAGWAIAGGQATHTNGADSGPLATTIPGVILNGLYMVVVNVVSQSSGSAQFSLGDSCNSGCTFPFVVGVNAYVMQAGNDSGTVAIQIIPTADSDIVLNRVDVYSVIPAFSVSNIDPSNTVFGTGAFANGSGSANSAFGSFALANNGDSNNNAFGDQALFAATSGHDNSAFGNQALTALLDGSRNLGFGELALAAITSANNNMAVGYGSGSRLTSGDANIFIGFTAGSNLASATNTLIVNSLTRFNDVHDLSDSIIVGVQSSTVKNQTLDFHAAVSSYITVVGSLPTCNSGMAGRFMTVTDALAPVYTATLVGGGAVMAIALCDGTNWTAH